jgi:hypothetical protein
MEHRLTLDPKRWSYQDYADFLAAYVRQNWEVALPLVMQVLVAWTYDLPIETDAYLQLPFPQLMAITESVNSTLKTYTEGIDVADASVNMTNWNMQDYFDFRKAARAGDTPVLETLLRKVVTLPDVELDERLDFEQGALMAKAVNVATRDMFSQGK